MVAELASPMPNFDFLHGAIGVSKEAGEVLDKACRNFAYSTPIDWDNIEEELGDILFYMELIRQSSNGWIAWERVERANIEKLSKRYPDGVFDRKDAEKRADKHEE